MPTSKCVFVKWEKNSRAMYWHWIYEMLIFPLHSTQGLGQCLNGTYWRTLHMTLIIMFNFACSFFLLWFCCLRAARKRFLCTWKFSIVCLISKDWHYKLRWVFINCLFYFFIDQIFFSIFQGLLTNNKLSFINPLTCVSVCWRISLLVHWMPIAFVEV